MMKYQPIKRVLCLIIAWLCTMSLAGCNDAGGNVTPGTESASSAGAAAQGSSAAAAQPGAQAEAEDLDASFDAASATQIVLSASGVSVTGGGAAADGSAVTIQSAGTYVVSGTLDDGRILIDAGKNDTVRVVLNGAHLTCSTSAPLYAKQAGKTILTLASGTENSVTDAAPYTYDNPQDEEPDAAVFCKDDLTINGDGALTVTANFKNGIGTKDHLLIVSGTINVTSVNDALRGRDSVSIRDGAFVLNAGGDGIQSNNDEDAAKGAVTLDGGSYAITTAGDGIQAETALQINGGTYSITTGGGSAQSAAKSNQAPASPQQRGGSASTAAQEDSVSTKGLKAGTDLAVSGGTFTIDSLDDAVHANGSVTVRQGSFQISTGDDGFHADDVLQIDGGEIDIATSYEGLEGADVVLNGGKIKLLSTDDGVNAAGGSDGDTSADTFRSGGGAHAISITGGTLYVDAGGDGIDSNGSVNISGGTTLVCGPTNSGNGALDYDSACEISGGVLIAAGSSGMMQSVSNTSAQNTLTILYSQTQPAGTAINLLDAGGNLALRFAPAKEYQSVVISAPQLTQGAAYTLTSGGACSGQDENGYWQSGSVTGDQKLTDVTLQSAVTVISDDGSAADLHTMGGGRGGAGKGGGRRGQMGGTLPDGTAPDGMPGGGFPAGGTPPDGTPPDGTPPDGAPNGMNPPPAAAASSATA